MGVTMRGIFLTILLNESLLIHIDVIKGFNTSTNWRENTIF